jgi:hypothetical protein
VKTYPLFPALDLSNVNRVQIGFLRQPLLTEVSFLAKRANCLPKSLALLLRSARHGTSAEQGKKNRNTPNMGSFLRLTSFIVGVELEFRTTLLRVVRIAWKGTTQ